MSQKSIISTDKAPQAIGPYSQAVRVGDTVYISGQVPVDPATQQLVGGSIEDQAARVFENIGAIAAEAGGSLNHAVKVNISLVDLAHFEAVNAVMKQFFKEPYPARACVQVAALPKGAQIEVEVILAL